MPETNDQPDALELLKRHGQAVSEHLRDVLRRFGQSAPASLIEAMEYSLLAGGKRLRPALVLECFRACGGNETSLHNALSAAAAMELIHTFSLVHDDLPAMDDDDFRRGRATNHKVFGEAMAILAGDAMLAMAFEVIAADADPTIAPRLIRELASACGTAGMIGGQVLDMAGEKQTLTIEQLQKIHRMKTGALLTASCRLGAISAGADEEHVKALSDYGAHLGLAFQIVDDILDVTSSPEQLGKATGKDAGRGKNTYPALLGLETSQMQAESELRQAASALERCAFSTHSLGELATFVARRKS